MNNIEFDTIKQKLDNNIEKLLGLNGTLGSWAHFIQKQVSEIELHRKEGTMPVEQQKSHQSYVVNRVFPDFIRDHKKLAGLFKQTIEVLMELMIKVHHSDATKWSCQCSTCAGKDNAIN